MKKILSTIIDVENNVKFHLTGDGIFMETQTGVFLDKFAATTGTRFTPNKVVHLFDQAEKIFNQEKAKRK